MNLSSIGPLVATADDLKQAADKLKKSTDDIEAIFIKDLLSAMRRAVPDTSLGKGMGAETYRDLFDQALSQSLSRTGSLGIGKMLFRQMAPGVLQSEFNKLKNSLANEKKA
ncbi:MAG TPA: rod-binding protein [Fimbriimonadaceae bacterium]|nr:rod-binding protein [Fimbriimonadaceae bacterium]